MAKFQDYFMPLWPGGKNPMNQTFWGSKDEAKQFQQYSPEQMQAMNQLWQGLQGGGGAFGDLFGQFNPEQTAGVFQKGVADPAMRNFRQNMMPQIMEGFADQGASSGLSNSLAGAAGNLQSDLASQLEMFMNQARMQQMNQRMTGLQNFMGANPYQTYIQQGSEGLLPGMMKQFAGGLGQSFNPFGGMMNMMPKFGGRQQGGGY